jgi:RNA polymerase sigma-70 factor (ECF subfamily)
VWKSVTAPDTGLRDLFDAEYSGLVRLATTIVGERATAEEIVQEAFARALARWRRLQHYERPGAWLRLVTVRLAVRARGRRARELTVSTVPEARREQPDNAHDVIDALAELTRPQRAAIGLFYFDDLPIDEIATILQLPSSTIRSHLHRGRAALAHLLTEPKDDARVE